MFTRKVSVRNMWIRACRRTDVIDKDWEFFKHKYVCSLHFQKCMYSKKQNLKKSAIPSLHLSEKPMQHDSYTQTWESIKYVKPYIEIHESKAAGQTSQSRADVSILYVMGNPEKKFETTQTQTEPSILYAKHNLEIKKEIEEGAFTHAQIKNSEESTQDIEIKKEIEDEISHTDEEPMQWVDPENEIKTEIEESVICYPQAEKSLQASDQVKQESSPSIEKVDGSNQTDRVIIYSLPRKRNECIDPQYCECKRIKRTMTETDIENVTLQQFLDGCEKFLSPTFCDLVKNQVFLDDLNKKLQDTQAAPESTKNTRDVSTDTSVDKSAGVANCIEAGAAECTNSNVADYVDAGTSNCPDAHAAGCNNTSVAVSDVACAADYPNADAADCNKTSVDDPVDAGASCYFHNPQQYVVICKQEDHGANPLEEIP